MNEAEPVIFGAVKTGGGHSVAAQHAGRDPDNGAGLAGNAATVRRSNAARDHPKVVSDPKYSQGSRHNPVYECISIEYSDNRFKKFSISASPDASPSNTVRL